MLNKECFCDFDTSFALKELGYNKPSNYTYYKNCRVSDEILKKHPGLSDCGYQDLVYDGIYTFDEVYKVYIEPLERYSRNSLIDDYETELCSCVHLYDAQKWLREEFELYVSVNFLMTEEGDFEYEIETRTGYDKLSSNMYKTYEEALLAGIKEGIKLIQEAMKDES